MPPRNPSHHQLSMQTSVSPPPRSKSATDSYIFQIQYIRDQAKSLLDSSNCPKPKKSSTKHPRSLSLRQQRIYRNEQQMLAYRNKNADKRITQKYYRMLIQQKKRKEKHNPYTEKTKDVLQFQQQKGYLKLYEEFLKQKKLKQQSESEGEADESVLESDMMRHINNLFMEQRINLYRQKHAEEPKIINSKLEASYEFHACRTVKSNQKKSKESLITNAFIRKYGNLANNKKGKRFNERCSNKDRITPDYGNRAKTTQTWRKNATIQ